MGDAKRAFDARPRPPDKPERAKPEKKRVRPTGRKPLPQHLEAEEHVRRPDRCGHCPSAALDAADETVEEKLHVVKEHQRRRVVRRTTCRCRECGGRTTPRSLPAPYERSKVTSDWLAWFVHAKFALLSPLDRIRRDLAERGVPLAMGTLVGFVERAADLLAPIDGLHWKQLLAGSWMATDGTGIKVLVPQLPAAHNGYIELYRNRECAVFQYAADKASDDVVAKLQTFRGTLTADAEHRFNPVCESATLSRPAATRTAAGGFATPSKRSQRSRPRVEHSSARSMAKRRRPESSVYKATCCELIGANECSPLSSNSSAGSWR
ncbi:MAG: transposase [Polyangiaceae bacterium]|nr:transposase [Polyangiaceae bacterium]